MSNSNCEDRNWFYVDNRRAMVSLGPLSQRRTCPYDCAFCYVQDGFIPYAQRDNKEIVEFLIRHRSEYDIVYVSGDTDSFAEPRRSQGLSLLRSIAESIDTDLLFTTRTTFTDPDFNNLQNIVKTLKAKEHDLYACISITRFSDNVSYLEPKPIPQPKDRIETLKRLHDIGAITVLALRPFIPVVDITDYLTILQLSDGYVDIALGETFYFQPDGKIQKRVFPTGISSDIRTSLKKKKMDFNKSDVEWSVWDDEHTEHILQSYCNSHNIVFSMRSASAILEFKQKKLRAYPEINDERE